MSQCWPEGALRAHLDGELAPEEMGRVAAHLNECAACARGSAELAARAQRVQDWMAELPAPQLDWVAPAAHRAPANRRWIGLAAALAAGLILAGWLRPRPRAEAPISAPVIAAVKPPEPVVAVSSPPPITSPPAPSSPRPRKARHSMPAPRN